MQFLRPTLIGIGIGVLLLITVMHRVAPSMLAEPQIWQAVIAGLFIAAGWLVTAEVGRHTERRQQAQRRSDIGRALRSEIYSFRWQLADGLDLGEATKRLGAIRDAMAIRIENEDLVPFVATEHNDTVYRTVLPEIHVLAEDAIAAVVRFYDVLKNVEDLGADLRTASYAALAANWGSGS